VNPLSNEVEAHGSGLKVSQWLIDQGVDVRITREDIRKKGAEYTLNAAGVATLLSTATDAKSALAESHPSTHTRERSSSCP
jgi:predicted Fe-Mo cluster-binding NifX family protein